MISEILPLTKTTEVKLAIRWNSFRRNLIRSNSLLRSFLIKLCKLREKGLRRKKVSKTRLKFKGIWAYHKSLSECRTSLFVWFHVSGRYRCRGSGPGRGRHQIRHQLRLPEQFGGLHPQDWQDWPPRPHRHRVHLLHSQERLQGQRSDLGKKTYFIIKFNFPIDNHQFVCFIPEGFGRLLWSKIKT